MAAAYYGVGKHCTSSTDLLDLTSSNVNQDSDVHIEDRIPMFKASYNTNTEEDDDPLTITSVYGLHASSTCSACASSSYHFFGFISGWKHDVLCNGLCTRSSSSF